MREWISEEILQAKLREMGIDDISRTTIRQCSMIGSALEAESGETFSHLEFGVPGIPACPIGIEAQKKALDSGVPSIYPSVQGIPELKTNAARFIKAFIDIDIDPKGIVPTVGSMQASMTSILECSQLQPGKDTILYICPGFSAHGRQPDILGIKNLTFDIYEYRAEKLRDKLESYFSQGNIAAILYSNPNNPAWICLTEEELQIIGELATKYDVTVLEDIAYLCMDFRKDLSVPFQQRNKVSRGNHPQFRMAPADQCLRADDFRRIEADIVLRLVMHFKLVGVQRALQIVQQAMLKRLPLLHLLVEDNQVLFEVVLDHGACRACLVKHLDRFHALLPGHYAHPQADS